MLPTPSTSHISFDRIYEPAEDSFLLLDTLSSNDEVSFLHERFSATAEYDKDSRAPLVVEVGVGSGVVLAFVAANAETILGRSDVFVLGTDLNTFSCKAAVETVGKALEDTNGDAKSRLPSKATSLGSVIANLAGPIRGSETDILIFNPPYVPTEATPDLETTVQVSGESLSHFEKDSHLLALSYAGGKEGMEVTNRLLAALPEILHRKYGVAYILLCAQNKPEKVKDVIRSWGSSWAVKAVGTSGKSAGWEKLQVLRIWRV